MSPCPSPLLLSPPRNIAFGSQDGDLFVSLLSTYPIISCEPCPFRNSKIPWSHKYKNCSESPAMRSTNAEKSSPPSASHGAAATDHRGELFVTEPFHMQIPRPWVLLIQHSTLALVYTMCTRGLFRTNCPGLFLLLEAPVCRSKLLICVSATFKGEVLKASLSSNCLSRNFYGYCVSRKRSLPFTERGHLSQ